jgi:nitroreductase
MTTVVIVPAAGKGSRMGADKALLELGGQAAIARLCEQCLQAAASLVLVVRARGATPLPALPPAVRTVEVDGEGEMVDSLRRALAALPADATTVVVLPVDHALVAADTIAAVGALAQQPGAGIALPLFRGRAGHPVALRREVFAEIALARVTSLRDVVRADAARVRAVPTANPWVIADLDDPDDLRAARAALQAEPWCATELMRRHRSHRAYAATPLADGQLERLVDAARHASTSSFIQAYSVIAVRDGARKAAVARLCADQQHIAQAPVFAAVCADLHKIAVACRRLRQTPQTQSFELFLQATVDAALLGQNLQLAAESEGLGACMIGAARNHPVELAQLLALPPHAYVVFGMTIGHAADDPVPRGRMPLAGVLHSETYDQAGTDAVLAGADAAMRDWARRTNRERGGYQGRPVNEQKGWVERMAQLWGDHSSYVRARATLVDELRQLGLGLL